MPSFSYTALTNPYASSSQTPPSVENALRNLTRSRSVAPPAPAIVQSIQEQVLGNEKSIEWSLELAQGLASYALHLLDLWCVVSKDDDDAKSLEEIPDGGMAVLFLLATAMEQWSDDVLYAVLLVQESDSQKQKQRSSQNLLDLLTKLTAVHCKSSISLTALSGLATSYRALDRLQQMTSLHPNHPDTAWWISKGGDTSHLAPLAVQCLKSDIVAGSPTTRQFSPSSEHIKLAATSILSSLLKHEHKDWLEDLSEEQLGTLCQHLSVEIQVLNNPQLPTSYTRYTLPCALLSASLLSLIQWRNKLNMSEFDRMIHTTSLVENVVHFSYPYPQTTSPSSESGGPRWTWDDQHDKSRIYALDLVYCWSLSGNEAWSVFGKLESHWRPNVEGFWNHALLDLSKKNNPSNDLEKTLPGIFVLYNSSWLAMRGILFSVFQRAMGRSDDMVAPAHQILTSLMQMSRHPLFSVKILSIRLMWVLLSDRKSLSTHDDLSRAFWSSLDEAMLEGSMKMVLDYATTADIQQPLLLTLLDLLDTKLRLTEHCDFILCRLGADTLEKLIYLIKPKEVKFDFMDPFDSEAETELDSDTPPANNLSRMDEKSICIPHEEEKEPNGLDNAVRLTAAAALARLGYASSMSTEEGIGLLKSRICTSVNDFVVSYHQDDASEEGTSVLSLDLSKRSFRLQLAAGTSENEDFVATMLFTTQVIRQNKLSQLRDESIKARQKLEVAQQKEKKLQQEKNRYMQQCRSQSIVFQREMSRMKESTTQDARQLVAIHASERSNAETRVSEYAQRIEQTESQLEQAMRQAQESQKTEVLTKEELQIAVSKVGNLQHENEDLSRQISQEEAKASELADELHSQTEKLDSLFRTRQELEEEVHSRDQIISDIEGANGKLQEDLEDLFADMVSLTQIYQSKEKEEAHNKEYNGKAIEEVNGHLRLERQKIEELSGTMEQLRQENDKLYKKLAKYKERLEEERRDRQDEASRRKRNGPVSYINQLHQSTASDKSSSRDRSSRKESASEKSKSRVDKENGVYYTASGTQRRKYY